MDKLEERLWGVPGAEVLYDDPATCYDAHIGEVTDADTSGTPFRIEEWSAHPPRYHMPCVQTVAAWVAEWVADNGDTNEYGLCDFEAAAVDAEVDAALDAALDVWATKITHRMADRLIATHTVTWDDAGGPLLDGDPMYGGAG